ncbi:hypothetical protein VTL71DRAFT_13990 [Oculimacula yallundae]|uniref:FAD-binding domain-containing protein n=1 Tax=Oculimacula yallundae TaxID=86028 RepID=A0ABR4CMH0_9HELO
MSTFDVIIIGAGLAGPLLANGLIASGISVRIYEKQLVDAKREGYQIRIAEPSLQSFDMMLENDKIDKIKSKMGRFAQRQRTTPFWYDADFRFLFDMGRVSSKYHGSAPMDRVVLRDILIEKPTLQGVLHYGKSFTSYEILNQNKHDEKVRVRFEDGTAAECHLLIAADGSQSGINKMIGLDNIRDIPVYNFITKARLSDELFAKLPHTAQTAPILVTSDKKTFFCVAYLPAKDHASDASTSKDAFDEGRATFTFSILIPIEDCPKDVRSWDKRDQWNFLSQAVEGWNPVYRQIIDVVKDEQLWVFQPRAAVRPTLTWRDKVKSNTVPGLGHPRVWVLGDAFHPMLPNRGMGGNQAMFDTTIILPLVKKLNAIHDANGAVATSQIAEACKVFEQEMIPRAFYWVEASGGVEAVQFDTRTLKGQFIVVVIRVTATFQEMWTAVKALFRGSSKGEKHD